MWKAGEVDKLGKSEQRKLHTRKWSLEFVFGEAQTPSSGIEGNENGTVLGCGEVVGMA